MMEYGGAVKNERVDESQILMLGKKNDNRQMGMLLPM